MSAIIKVSKKAPELGTFALTFDFYEMLVNQSQLTNDSETAVPNSLVWSLRNYDGAVVNGRHNVAATPGESVTIVLHGDDLSLDDGLHRVLVVEGTYSSTLGDNLPLKVEAHFEVENLRGVFSGQEAGQLPGGETGGWTAVTLAERSWLVYQPQVRGFFMQKDEPEPGETVTIPAGHTMLSTRPITGSVEVEGRLVVLGTAAEADVEEFADLLTTAVSAHNNERDDVHGIADTRLLETQAGAQDKATTAASAAQAFAVQRANHTGTQLLATISNAGTMAAQAATNYHATSVFSANPTTDQPLKANGTGGLRLARLGIGIDATAQVHVVSSAAATIGAIVRVAASATANAQQWQNSSAAVMAAVTATGTLELGQQATSSHEISGKLRSSTTANTQAARVAWSWSVSTHATRQAKIDLYVSDYGAERLAATFGANGTAATVGFYGVTAVARQLLATGAGATVDQVITALQNLGLLRQS